MMRLPLTVPLRPGETVTSFTSRLAAENGRTANEFCRDFGIAFGDIVKGDTAAIAKIAGLAGADKPMLQDQTVVRSKYRYGYRGQLLDRNTVRTTEIRFCLACLRADIRAGRAVDPEIAVYGRAAWMIEAIKTCHVHDMPLVPTARRPARHIFHDFSLNIRPSIPALARLVASAPRRRPNGLELYVLARLDGTAKSEFLDGLELFAAIKVCEVIGAVSLYGKNVVLKTMPEEKMVAALGRGFEIAHGGPDGIRKFLDKLMLAADDRRRRDGSGAVFGRLYEWLTAHQQDAAYAPIRVLVAEYVFDRYPYGAHSRVLGIATPKQTRHSVRTLSLEAGQHPKKLRKVLRAAGVIDDRQMAFSDNNVTFDAQAGSAAAQSAKRCLYLPAVRDRLNVSRIQADLLIKHRFIQPRDPIAGAYDKYAIDDLDAFLGGLLRGAKTVDRLTAAMDGIPKAAKRAYCSSSDVIRMILERRLAWTGRLRGVRGYRSVLVKIDEVKAAVRGPEHGGVPLRQVGKVLRTHDLVVSALIAGKYLPSFRAVNPATRFMQTLVAPEELARFHKTYVSLHVLAKERKLHHLTMKIELDAAGIQPAFDHEKVRARFYRRSDC
jgi:hypothetical protein